MTKPVRNLAAAFCFFIVLSVSQLHAAEFSAGDILGFDEPGVLASFGSLFRIDPDSGTIEELISLANYNGINQTNLDFLDVLGPNRLLLAGEGPGFRQGLDVEELYELNIHTNTLTRLSRFQEAKDNAGFPPPPQILTDPLGVGVSILVEPDGNLFLQEEFSNDELLRFDINTALLEFIRQDGGISPEEIVAITDSGRFIGRVFTDALFEVSGEEFGVGDRLLSTTSDIDPDIVRPLGENTIAVFDDRRRNFLAFDIDTLQATTLASFRLALPSVEDFVVLDDGDILFASNFAGPALGRIEAGTDQVTVLLDGILPAVPRFSQLFVVPSIIPEPGSLVMAMTGLVGCVVRIRKR